VTELPPAAEENVLGIRIVDNRIILSAVVCYVWPRLDRIAFYPPLFTYLRVNNYVNIVMGFVCCVGVFEMHGLAAYSEYNV
jgi:hypothetical protein